MKKEQGRKVRAGVKKASGKRPERKRVVKMRVTGNTEILDFDLLEEELKQPEPKKAKPVSEKKTASRVDETKKAEKKESKTAAKTSGEKKSKKPAQVSDETLELLELDELLALEAEKREPLKEEKKAIQEPPVEREKAAKESLKNGQKAKKESKAPREDDSYLTFEPKKKKESRAPEKDESYLTFEPKKKKESRAPEKDESYLAFEPKKKKESRAPEKDESYLAFEPKKKKESRAPEKDGSYLAFEPKKKAEAEGKPEKRSSGKSADTKKKKGGGSDFGFVDVIIALTGVLVLLVGGIAFGVYRDAAEVEQQVAAVAQVGEKMETIGVAGESIFVAVADARIAAQELANDLPADTEGEEQEHEYEEKDLVSKVSVALKLTSVQKDLKIKFTNKESGKLIGNQAFTVKIDGPENLTKTDDDKDGIIYISSIKPGAYTVTITSPDEIDGTAVSGIKGTVTVKDQIEYKKIDVTDEVKKESEINVAKEDTAVAPPVESTVTDTVEWVESTKTPLNSEGSVTYEQVNKSDIPEPSTTALLDMIWTVDGENGSYLQNTVKLEQNASLYGPGMVKTLEKGVYFTQETETATSQATEPNAGDGGNNEGGNGDNNNGDDNTANPTEPTESTQSPEKENEFKVTGVKISGDGECKVGDSITLTADAETTGEGKLSDSDYSWSGASGSGKTATFSASSAGTHEVSVTVKGVKATKTITVKEKPVEVTVSGVSVSTSAARVEIGKSATITATVSMSDGSNNYNGAIDWFASGGQISGSGTSVTISSSTAQKVKVTAKAGGKENSVEVEFYDPNVKVNKINIPGSVSVAINGTIALSLDVQPSDSKDKSVEWKVTEGSDVASVDANGTVKGLKIGTAKVQAIAKDGSKVSSNTCTVTVTSNVGVKLEAPGTMAVGEEKKMKYTTTGEIDATEWRVSDEKIATVDKDGKVKAIAAGKVTVTIKVKGKDGTKVESEGELTVSAAGVDEIKLEPATISCKVGEKKTIKATVTTKGNKAVTWKSSDESIVKITESKDDSCTIEALKVGKTTIVVTSKEDEKKTAKVEVTVELKDGTALLKDKNGNQLYYKNGDEYKEATAADYYKYDVFYRKKDTTQYLYTGWQTIDGARYYFDKNGTAVTGEQTIQGVKYSFNSDGSLKVTGAMGIDISKHNGSIDWNAVKNAGVNYVILRCGYRGSASGVLVEDEKFKSNIQGAQAAGLKVGIYFFSQAVNEVEAVEEASLTLSLIRNYKITYPVYMDVEAANGRADGLDSATRTKVIRAFCETVRNSGYTAGVYANKTWLGSKMDVGSLGSYKIWLAQYAATPTYSGRYEMWQYSSTGKIAGISGNVDLNISYMSY